MKRLGILLPGRRKAVYGTAAFIAMCVHAAITKADFGQFSNAMQWWLGLMLAGHVAQQVNKKPEMLQEKSP